MTFRPFKYLSNWYIIPFLVVLSLTSRVLLSFPIGCNSDVIFKWAMIRDYVENGVLPSLQFLGTHHALRWAINLPVIFIQKIFGTEPQNYYLWPFFSATLGTVFSYLIVKNIHSKIWGILSALAFTFSTHMLRQGSQFFPMGATTAYLLGSVFFFQIWAHSKRMSLLILCTMFLFFSYGSKITSLYYFPAFTIMILLFSNSTEIKKTSSYFSFKPITFFILLILLFFGAEAILTSKISQVSGGRVVCLAKGQHGNPEVRKKEHAVKIEKKDWNYVSTTLPQYLGNIFVYHKYYPKNLPRYYNYILYIGLILAIAVLVLKRRTLYCLSIPYLCGFFGHAYAIVGVYPFLRPEKMNFRYHTSIYILATLLIIAFLGSMERHQLELKPGNTKNLTNRYYLLICISLTVLIICTNCKPSIFSNGYVQTIQNQRAISRARKRGETILIRTHAFKRRTSYAYYLSFYSPTPNYYHRHSVINDYNYKLYRKRKALFVIVENNGVGNFSFNKPHIILK